jgi:hypothetical protein
MLSVFPSLILPRSGRFPFCFWACLGELRFSSSFVAYIAHFLFTCLVFACSFVGCAKKASVSHPRSSEWQPRSLLSPSWFWFSTQSFAPKISSPLCFPLMCFSLTCSWVESSVRSSGRTLPPSLFPFAGSGVHARSAHTVSRAPCCGLPSLAASQVPVSIPCPAIFHHFLGFTVGLCRARACSSNFSH